MIQYTHDGRIDTLLKKRAKNMNDNSDVFIKSTKYES